MGLREDLKISDETIDPVEMLGVYNLSTPNKSSGPRMHLTGTYFEQSLIINEAESPRMYTGFEKELGSYNDSLKRAKCQYRIINRIEKFPSNPGYHYTLIVQDITTGVYGIIENKHYESLAEEHGYFRPYLQVDQKIPGNIIELNEVISKSPSHDQYLNYRYGINANIAYISDKDNIEDGMKISESFAKRVSYASIKNVEITLGFNDVLLNMYGDNVIYKSFPDIFEEVKNGIFCVKRSIDHSSGSSSITAKSLMKIETSDEIIHGNGKILDIEIFINSNVELLKDNAHRQQIIAYYNLIREYKNNIVRHFEPLFRNKLNQFTEEALNKFHSCKNYIDSCNSQANDIRYSVPSSGNPFEFAYIKFVIGRNVNISEGSKLTNRFGGKGVTTVEVKEIIPDSIMPRDEFGNVADIILNPIGVIGRSNPGQSYEQELNFIADRVADKIKNEPELHEKYKILHKFLSMVDVENCQKFESYYKTLSNVDKHHFFINIITNGIYIRQHPYNNISFEGLKQLYIQFDVKPGPVTIGIKVDVGNGDMQYRYYKSKNSVIIGKEYIMILKHTTDSKFSSVSISDVNSIGLPHKNTSKSKNLPFRQTPIKFGEMEVNIAINRVPPVIVNRLLAGNGSNLRHRERVAKMLLTEDPMMYHDVNIASEDIINNTASDAFTAILHQLGYVIYSDRRLKQTIVGMPPEIVK